MAVVQILVFAFFTLLAHNSWAYDVNIICRGDASCQVVGWNPECSICNEGQGNNSYVDYTVGQSVQVDGKYGCVVTGVTGGYQSGCPAQGYCRDKKIEVGCWNSPQISSSSAQSSSTTAPPVPPTTCQYCEDYTDYNSFPTVRKSKSYVCTNCVADSLGQIMSAQGCTVVRDGEGTCRDNGDCPNGQVCKDTVDNVDCYATVGATVYLRDRKSGHVWGCDADGSCQMALAKYAQGECQDPNSPTPTSDASGNSSSSGEGTSSEGGSSGSQGPWGLEKTLKENTAYAKNTAENTGDIANYTVTIMGKTSDIYNELIEHGITLNNIKDNTDDIKTNTGATATNTGNINDKLTTTNSLLTDIKNKDWEPDIHVNPNVTVEGDTNIINVENNVTTDTAKSGAAILDYLKGIFGTLDTTSNYNPDDTVGSGASVDSVMDRIGALVDDSSYLAVGDSVGVAVQGMKTSYNALKDTLGNSAISDSLNRWGQAITNNGVITGNGSDNCPSILERDWELNFGLGVTVTAGHLGRYICTPIGGLSITIWALCRVLLRAIVAIGCMLWLYKAVLGIDGGSNDED